MDNTNRQQQIMKVMKAVIETVIDCEKEFNGNGSPSTAIYLAMASLGMSMDSYQTLMAGLVNAGALTLDNNCYHSTPLGREYVMAADRVMARITN